MNKFKKLILLFLEMFKIGLFTFGGGYAMLSILQNEFVLKKGWLTDDEFSDLVVIAEATPGPIAINCSTYIGFKRAKIIGAIIATLGVVLPSFIIIFLISLFFNQFMENIYFASFFKGIRACVIFLIVTAGIKLFKKIDKDFYSILIFLLTLIISTLFSLFMIDFSSVFYILISAFMGLLIYLIKKLKGKGVNNHDLS